MAEVEYRAMGKSDLEQVRDLVERTLRTSYHGVYSEAAIEFFVHYHGEEAILGDIRTSICLVALDGGKLIGTATLRGDAITRVFVEPERQGAGIGRALVMALLERARSDGIMVVRLDASLVSKAFYERLGFEVAADRAHDLGGGETLPYHEMQMRL